MDKYTLGTLVTAISCAFLVLQLTNSYGAGIYSSFVVIGLSYMVSAIVESMLKALKK